MKKNYETTETEENHKDREDCSMGKWINSEHVGSSLYGHLAAETQKYWKQCRNTGRQSSSNRKKWKTGSYQKFPCSATPGE